jgi:spore maturation protein CgeB
LETYKDINELNEKINYYLLHDNEREHIARAGYEWVINNHTYDKRIENLINLIRREV